MRSNIWRLFWLWSGGRWHFLTGGYQALFEQEGTHIHPGELYIRWHMGVRNHNWNLPFSACIFYQFSIWLKCPYNDKTACHGN